MAYKKRLEGWFFFLKKISVKTFFSPLLKLSCHVLNGGGWRSGRLGEKRELLKAFIFISAITQSLLRCDRRRKAANQTYVHCISIGLQFGFQHFEICIISAVKGHSVHGNDEPKTLRYPPQSLVILSNSGRTRNQDRLSSAWWELLRLRADLQLPTFKKLKCGVCIQFTLDLKRQCSGWNPDQAKPTENEFSCSMVNKSSVVKILMFWSFPLIVSDLPCQPIEKVNNKG